jgi:hypothetical protein
VYLCGLHCPASSNGIERMNCDADTLDNTIEESRLIVY